MILIGDKWIELPSTFHFLDLLSVKRDKFGNDPTQANPKLCFDEYLFFSLKIFLVLARVFLGRFLDKRATYYPNGFFFCLGLRPIIIEGLSVA